MYESHPASCLLPVMKANSSLQGIFGWLACVESHEGNPETYRNSTRAPTKMLLGGNLKDIIGSLSWYRCNRPHLLLIVLPSEDREGLQIVSGSRHLLPTFIRWA